MPRTFELLVVILLSVLTPWVYAQDVAQVPMADGFECPVGRDAAKKYFKARGFRANGHLGEDWNGVGGGDTDLGDPVYSTAHGLVVYARNFRMGWGNVVIIRHAYQENGQTLFVDSLYGHLHEILVREGQLTTRGQKIGTIGNNHGMYDAHLHFEIRKNIRVGMFRHSFPRDFTTYWDPTQFITARQTLPGAGRMASIPINTFPASAPPPVIGAASASPLNRANTKRSPNFKVDRFSDLRE